MSELIVIKSQETRNGVRFRVIKDGKFCFLDKAFNNYFYVTDITYEIAKQNGLMDRFSRYIIATSSNGKFTKIELSDNFIRSTLRDFFEHFGKTYEADLRSNKRLLIDNNIELNNQKIPYLFFDIETDDRKPIRKDEKGDILVYPESRILSFSGVDNKGEVFYYELEEDTLEAEQKLLMSIIRLFANYGVISGWNSNGFDMPYIKQRCEIVGVHCEILEFINHLDYMEVFKKYDKKSRPSFSLNAISKEVLGEEKLEQEKGDGKIYATWLNDKEHLKLYNIQDSQLIYNMDKKLNFIMVSYKRADYAKCHVIETMQNSRSGDYLLLREYKKRGIIMPSTPNKKDLEERKKKGSIGGGYTNCFLPGVYKEVHVWDMKSLYPSIMQTWNISPETYVETIEDENAVLDWSKFCITPADFENYMHRPKVFKREEGVVPFVVRKLVEERDKIKYKIEEKVVVDGKEIKFKEAYPDEYRALYLEQYARKTDANSVFGILSFPSSRYYFWEVGDAVTTCARATLKSCNMKFQEWGCRVLGGDTDSAFVEIGENTFEELDKRLVVHFKEFTAKYHCPVNKLLNEHEKIFSPMLFVMKKNYAYKLQGEDKIKITGMECIKSDANPYAAKMQKEFIYDILNNKVNDEDWRNKVNSVYLKVFENQLLPADLILIKALTKMPDGYKGYIIDSKTKQPKVKKDGTLQEKAIPAHVKLASRMMSQGKDLYVGSKIRYVVVKEKPIVALSEEEFKKGKGEYRYKDKKVEKVFEFGGQYDSKYYWRRIIKPLLKVALVYYKGLPRWQLNLTNSEVLKLASAGDEDDE